MTNRSPPGSRAFGCAITKITTDPDRPLVTSSIGPGNRRRIRETEMIPAGLRAGQVISENNSLWRWKSAPAIYQTVIDHNVAVQANVDQTRARLSRARKVRPSARSMLKSGQPASSPDEAGRPSSPPLQPRGDSDGVSVQSVRCDVVRRTEWFVCQTETNYHPRHSDCRTLCVRRSRADFVPLLRVPVRLISVCTTIGLAPWIYGEPSWEHRSDTRLYFS